MDRIVITGWPLKDGFSFEGTFKGDADLSEAIDEFYERELKPKNIELFAKRQNCIATDAGTYGAFYESDLKHTE